MKKGLYIGVALLSTCLLSGCGSKTLKCTRENNYNDEMKMNQELKVSFENNKVTKLKLDTKVILNNDYAEYKDTFKTQLEDEFKEIKEAEVFKYSSKDNNDVFVFTIEENVNKMNKETKDKFNIINPEQSYDEAKKEFENNGYTCK